MFRLGKNIAIIGAGYWGKNLVRVFNDLSVLKSVCDLNLKNIKKEYPNLFFTENFKDILGDEEIKAVVISTPAATHYDFVKSSLLSGKDVFVEKPLALDVKKGEELVELAKQKKSILMVGHLLIYHPAVTRLKELIKRGELGDIRYIWSNRLNFGKLRKEENVLWSFAPHDISVIIDILGEPKKVLAVGKDYLQNNIPDVTLTSLEFNNQVSSHIFVSWLNPFKEQKLAVVGSEAMAVFDDQSDNKLVIYPHKIEWLDENIPEAIKVEGKIINIPTKEPLKEEVRHFIECLQKRKRPKTDGEEALMVLRVLDACQRSLDQKSKLISV